MEGISPHCSCGLPRNTRRRSLCTFGASVLSPTAFALVRPLKLVTLGSAAQPVPKKELLGKIRCSRRRQTSPLVPPLENSMHLLTLGRYAQVCENMTSSTKVYTTNCTATQQWPKAKRTENVVKFNAWLCKMRVDRQTDTLIAILHTCTGDKVIT